MLSIITLSILVLLSIVLIVLLTSVTKLNAFASLFIVALLLAMIALPDKDVVQILKEGFGSTMASIGFLIIFGAIIAVVLEKTGYFTLFGALPHSHTPGSIGRFGNSKCEYRHADIAGSTFCHSRCRNRIFLD